MGAQNYSNSPHEHTVRISSSTSFLCVRECKLKFVKQRAQSNQLTCDFFGVCVCVNSWAIQYARDKIAMQIRRALFVFFFQIAFGT